ncbi:MAG: ATP-binding protein [Myxococcaceae bacterium]|jgi:signal transduction histidine kinase|nr:ATP-binding protein [Myxococcaceae bacterium]
MFPVLTWLHVLAALSTVMVVVLASSRHANPALRLPLVLLAVDQFVLNACSVAGAFSADPAYNWLAASVTPPFTAFVLHLALAFTGTLRRFRGLLVAAYGVFLGEAVLVLLDWQTGLVDFDGALATHALVAAGTSAPVAVFGAWLLTTHLRASTGTERLRTWLFVTALVVGVPLMLTDLFFDMGLPVPPLSTAGSCVFNGLLIVITLGISSASRREQLGQAVLFALFVVVSFLTLFSVFRERQGLLVLSMTGFTFGLVAVGRLVWTAFARHQEGLTRFATLGRFSAQMAHDLKNPLAAARGAAELLEGEVKALSRDDLAQFSSLLVQQLDRLTGIIDRYQRLSRLELERQRVDVNALVEKVLSLQALAAGPSVELVTRLSPDGPHAALDPELIASALENLVKNAYEAMPAGGTVTVSTAVRGPTLSLAVKDTGQGMDARTREQAFGLFFTTKAQGSGLGLAFVQQIARAHGGEVTLESAEGVGTTVELRLPLASS